MIIVMWTAFILDSF